MFKKLLAALVMASFAACAFAAEDVTVSSETAPAAKPARHAKHHTKKHHHHRKAKKNKNAAAAAPAAPEPAPAAGQ
jgi:Ni/Co efflux regulator RcnB